MKISPSDRLKKTMPISIRLPRSLNKKLTEYAATEDRPKSWLIEQAVHDFVALREWQIAAIQEGIRQADAGMLIPHEKVVAWIKSWDGPNELPMPKSRPRAKPKTK
jgi:predicted transcriptional regulator